MNNKYIPIACHFYDELESIAVKKIKSKILYKDIDKIEEIEDFIVNFKTKNKEEFLILSSGLEIRLDKVIKINEIEPKNYC